MDHLLAADVLLGEDASLPITSGGSYQVLVNNVFYFTQRVVAAEVAGAGRLAIEEAVVYRGL